MSHNDRDWREFATTIADTMHEIAVAAIRAESAVHTAPAKSTPKADHQHERPPFNGSPSTVTAARAEISPQALEIIDAARWVMEELQGKKLRHKMEFTPRDQEMLNRLEAAFAP